MASRVWALILLVGLAAFVFLPNPATTAQDIALQMPAGPRPAALRLTVVGTSLTANYDWPDRVVDALASCLGYRPQISRIAQAGANSRWGVDQIQAVIATKPDIVLIEFAINDADLRDGVWLRQSATNHRVIIVALQAALPDTRIVLLTMSPAQGLRGWMRPRLGAFYSQYQTLAQDMNTGLIDLFPRWRALPQAKRGLDKDGLHPDKDIAASLIVPVITAYLRAAISGDICQF